MARNSYFGKPVGLSGIGLMVGGLLVFAVGAPAFATGPTRCTPGDVVVYETTGTSSASQAVNLVDYSVSSTPITGTTTATPGFSVPLPTADSAERACADRERVRP